MKTLKSIGNGFFRSADVHVPEKGPSIWRKIAMIGPLKLMFFPLLVLYCGWSTIYAIDFFVSGAPDMSHHRMRELFPVYGQVAAGTGIVIMLITLGLVVGTLIENWSIWAKKERTKWNS